MTLKDDLDAAELKAQKLQDDYDAAVAHSTELDTKLTAVQSALNSKQAELDAYKASHPDVVTPVPASAPKIKSITVGQDATGARIDIETTVPVSTYGHSVNAGWTSPAMPATQRKFDLTYLPYATDVPIKINFADGTTETRTVHTNPKVDSGPVITSPPTPVVVSPPSTKPQAVSGYPVRAADFARSIGVAIDAGYDPAFLPKNFEELAELGAGWIRVGAPSSTPDINTGYGGLTRYEWFKKMHNELGVKVNLISDCRNVSIADTVKMAKQYHEAEGWVASIELDNELDLARFGPVFDGFSLAGVGGDEAGQKKGVQLARTRTDKIIKAINDVGRPKDLIITSPSFAQMIKSALYDYFGPGSGLDAFTVHYYGGAKAIRTQHVALMKQLVDKCLPGLPIISTECGYSTAVGFAGGHPPVTEYIQAILTTQMYLEFALSNRMFAATNYLLRAKSYDQDGTGKPKDWEGGFGLVRGDETRKPAFHAVRRLIAWNKDVSPTAYSFTPVDPGVTVAGAGVRSLVTQHSSGNTLVHLALDGNLTAPADAYDPSLIINTKRNATVSWVAPKDINVRNVLLDNIIQSAKGIKTITLSVGQEPTIIEILP